MISTRSIVLASLIGLPVLVFSAVGGYAIRQSGSFDWVWWLMSGCGLAAWGVSRIWPARPPSSRTQHHLAPPEHWTPRDQDAAQVIRDYQLQVESHSAEELTDPHFYLRQVQSLAMDLARLYHPQATDPLEQLTVPEALAAVRLAVDDMERWMLESVPGSRLLTIRHWQMLQSAPAWMQRISETAWAVSILLTLANIARYFASKWSWDPVTEQLQSEVLAVVYLRFIRQVGYYLVEMNSGRLRGGADAYRCAFGTEQQQTRHRGGSRPLEDVESPTINIALTGQVSSGKSSLINLLTGEAQAAVDVLPKTSDVARYQWTLGDPPVTLTLLDTPGYGESGASQQQVQQIHRALEESDAALLVMDAHSPGREADRQTLEQLQSMSRTRPHLKPPAIVGVLTHVDLLSPPLEWSPPYNWRMPESPKSRSLHDAVAHVSELFPGSLIQTVPVCSDARSDRQWGVVEELLPALVELLDEVRSVALLRAYEESLDQRRWNTLLAQITRSGRQLLQAWIDERLQHPPRAE